MKLRSDVEKKRIEAKERNRELQDRLVRIFEAASVNSEIFMRRQNGCMVLEDRCPADFSDYARLMASNSLTLSDMNSSMKLSFTDSRTGHHWAFLLNKTDFFAIEAELEVKETPLKATV